MRLRTDLGAVAVKAAVERAGIAGEDIDRAYIGCVLPAGLGQAPARQAAIKAGLPLSVEATTVNKVWRQRHADRDHGRRGARQRHHRTMVVAGGMEKHDQCALSLGKSTGPGARAWT